MRLEIRRAALVLLGVAAFCMAGCGGEDEDNPFAPMFARYKHTVHGTVSKLDGTARSFAVTDKKGREYGFTWDEGTKMDGTLADGSGATVRYKKKDGKMMAMKVKVFPAAAPAATAPAAPVQSSTAPSTTGEKK